MLWGHTTLGTAPQSLGSWLRGPFAGRLRVHCIAQMNCNLHDVLHITGYLMKCRLHLPLSKRHSNDWQLHDTTRVCGITCFVPNTTS
eukprot:scaffold67880_cov17-Prasinocladus_malaysianus.AAC.3